MKTQNEKIQATPNYSKKTFTLRKYVDGKLSAKYRTLPTSQYEFDQDLYNTSNDWRYFLKTDNYYVVKQY